MRYDNSITYFYSDADGATRFFVNDKLLDDGISGHADAFLSCDGTVGIARGGSGLYRIDGEGIKKIYPAGVDRALLSLDNSMIVFTTATEVHVYDHGTGSIEDIKPEGVTGIASIAISPDGSTVGYSIKSKDGNFYAYAYENGESRKLSNDAYLVAIRRPSGITSGRPTFRSITPCPPASAGSARTFRALWSSTAASPRSRSI